MPRAYCTSPLPQPHFGLGVREHKGWGNKKWPYIVTYVGWDRTNTARFLESFCYYLIKMMYICVPDRGLGKSLAPEIPGTSLRKVCEGGGYASQVRSGPA
jgi:hypothetical protein